MRRVIRSLAVLVPALILGARGEAWAHSEQFELAGRKLLLKTTGAPSARKFVFKATRQPVINPTHDPAAEGAALLVRGTGASGGSTGLIQLDPSLWKGLGSPAGSKGYRYTDASASRGGVKKVLYRPGAGGGSLTIIARGAKWPWAPGGAQDSVWVHFQVADEWYCAQFGGITKNEGGHIAAKNAAAPDTCPASLCGNGVLETGEACDDGNLNEIDGCTAACTLAACVGGAFTSTWEAIQSTVFAGGGCQSSFCHSGPAPAGGLNLEPANAYANLVGVPSTISPLERVFPGDQDLSFLYLKLAAATLAPSGPSVPGSPMPAGGLPALSTDALEALKLWIRAGAPEAGVVEGTATLLASCLPPPTPQKIPPLDPPPAGAGAQFYAPPWDLPAQSEDEVCYSVYYDFTGLVPASAQAPCPSWLGGAGETCFRYHETELAQDPQSHHSILHIYRGAYDWTDPGWGAWTCKGGPNAGTPCNPINVGVPAPAGADCGPRAGCTGAVESTVACILYGPPDYGFFNDVAPTFGGAQEPYLNTTYAAGVSNFMPVKGIAVVNSHAFNLTDIDSTMEQYFNFHFAAPADQLYQVQGIFDDTDIFVQNVPPFETREYCRTFTLPQYARLFELSSHTHKRGVLFRIWAPPNTACSSATGPCLPNAEPPLYVSTEYNDPVQLILDPPVPHPGNAASRRYKFCSLYDNGATDPALVKRRSTSPAPPLPFTPGGPCAVSETRCIGGPQHNQLCNGDHAVCDSSAGAGDGVCDACPLRGGVTTEDEMLIMLGAYYVAP